MRVFARYMMFQAAGWGLAALILGACVHRDWISVWLAVALLTILLLKDLVLFPYVRKAYEPSATHGGEALLGAVACVERSLTPEGWIRVGAERWRARVRGSQRDLQPGEYVEVREIDNLVLIVEAVDAEPPARVDTAAGRV